MQFPKISILPSQKILEFPVVQGGHSVRPKNRVRTGPGKPGFQVLEFWYGIFKDWKVLEKGHWSWKVLEIC